MSKVFRPKASMFGHTSKHLRANLIVIMKRKLVVWILEMGENTVRAVLALHAPTVPKECR